MIHLQDKVRELERHLGITPSDPIRDPHQNPYLRPGPIEWHAGPLFGDTSSQPATSQPLPYSTRRRYGPPGKARSSGSPRPPQREGPEPPSSASPSRQQTQCRSCGQPVGADPRLDHIYPVAKGGLWVTTNLVFVCLQCNQRKSDMTLAAHLRANNLDRATVEARLTGLGKDFLTRPPRAPATCRAPPPRPPNRQPGACNPPSHPPIAPSMRNNLKTTVLPALPSPSCSLRSALLSPQP